MTRPEILNSIKKYTLKNFFSDSLSGLIVFVVALPLSVAFAIASGVSPQRGLVSAIIGGFIVSILGGSRFYIAGPSGTFVVLVYAVVSRYGYAGLAVMTLMSGVILIFMGSFRLGGLIHFVPYTIITGFTAGAAVLIVVSQLGNFFGLSSTTHPADFIGKILAYIGSSPSFNPIAFVLSVLSLAFIYVGPKLKIPFPAPLIVIVISTVIVSFFNLNVDTIGTHYGTIPHYFSFSAFPPFSLHLIQDLLQPAFSLAILIAIETLLCGVVADGMSGHKHNANTDLIAHGIANIVCPFFGGIPVTSAVERTVTNIRSGGKTPISGIVNSLVLLLMMFSFARYAELIPMPVIAAVLIHVSWTMWDLSSIRLILHAQKADIAVMLATFIVTVFISITIALEVGLLMTAFFFIKKMIELSSFSLVKAEMDSADHDSSKVDPNSLNLRTIPKGIVVFEIEGPLFFGSVQKFEQSLEQSGYKYAVLILRMRNTVYLDAGGIRLLEQLYYECQKKEIVLLLSDIHTQPFMLASKTGLDVLLGENAVFGNLDEALEYAATLLS
ncbi:MAG TPA: SulP family inorganic anion transporter [Treponemataceae bacterium]|nr:SulP family inorganic anion transporter [Treponemataceae bacterium]